MTVLILVPIPILIPIPRNAIETHGIRAQFNTDTDTDTEIETDTDLSSCGPRSLAVYRDVRVPTLPGLRELEEVLLGVRSDLHDSPGLYQGRYLLPPLAVHL